MYRPKDVVNLDKISLSFKAKDNQLSEIEWSYHYYVLKVGHIERVNMYLEVGNWAGELQQAIDKLEAKEAADTYL